MSAHIFVTEERADFGACARVQRHKKGGKALKQISERVCRVQTLVFGKKKMCI